MIKPGTVVRLNSAKGAIERVVVKDHGDHVTVSRAEEIAAAKLEGRAARRSTFPKSALVNGADGRAEVAVATAGALTDAHRAAIKALHRASPERAATSCAADITMLELAARMAVGLPVSDDAVREVGRRYVELIVELGKQVDARMSAEADALAIAADISTESMVTP